MEAKQKLLEAVWATQERYWQEREALVQREAQVGRFITAYLSQVVPVMGHVPPEEEKWPDVEADIAPRLKKRYAECVKLCHPDVNPGSEPDHALFAAMRDAYVERHAVRLEALYLLAKLKHIPEGEAQKRFLHETYQEIRSALEEVRCDREAFEASPEYMLWRRHVLARERGVDLTQQVVSQLSARQATC